MNEVISKEYRDRESTERDYVYASELGGSIFDVWMKMKNQPVTHPPNARAYRKFKMGNRLESEVKELYEIAGLLVHDEKRVTREPTNDMVGISGRLDFFLSYDGMIDRAKKYSNLPDWKNDLLQNILKSPPINPNRPVYYESDEEAEKDKLSVAELLEMNAPIEPRSWIVELKSVSSQMFPQREQEPAPNHWLQAGFYSKEEDVPALIEYINKDDGFMATHFVDVNDAEEKTTEWLKELSGYYEANERPPLEPLIINEGGRCKKNWKVEYSNYLGEYGFEMPMQYREAVDKKIGRWNRVLKRVEDRAKMTDDNLAALDEMIDYFKTGEL